MAAAPENPQDQFNEIWWPILAAKDANKMDLVNYILEPTEKLIMCPYDNYHWIRFKRTSSHLQRCRRNFEKAIRGAGGEVPMLICRYNDAHKVMEPEIQYHEAQCPNKLVSVKSELDAIEKYAPALDRQPNLEMEEWQIHPDIQAYDPREKLKDHFYYIPHVTATLSKAEKKKFQAGQRLRFFTHVTGEIWAGLDKPSPALENEGQVVDNVAVRTSQTLGDYLWSIKIDKKDANQDLDRPDEALIRFADLETTSRGSTVELFKLSLD